MKPTTSIHDMKSDFFIETSENYGKNAPAAAHYHGYYEIYYLKSGKMEYYIDDNLYHVQKGDLVIVTPNSIHKTNRVSNVDRSRILLWFSEDFIRTYLSDRSDLLECFRNCLFRPNKQKIEQIEYLLMQLSAEYYTIQNDYVMIKALLTQLLVIVERLFLENIEVVNVDEYDLDNPKMIEIARYINSHFSENLQVKTVAKIFHMNPSYISRTFKKVLGFTFSEHLLNVRLRCASDLLLKTDLNVTEISEETGFSSCTDFCRVFKTAMGVTPLKYRKLK